MNNQTYLSVVVTSRNDDHGGELLRRMQIFISSFVEQCRIHNLSAELIIVEWNPPSDRPRFRTALAWPEMTGPCRIRIIEVPPELHGTYANADKLRLFQMIAKNVGIRRARGEYILATNIDILFSPELMEFFARKQLQDDKMYRVDRYDVNPDIPGDSTINNQMRFCSENVIRVNSKNGTIYISNPGADQYLVWKILKGIISRIIRIFWGGGDCGKLLHTNACGDFTLMKKTHWIRLRGYPELPICSMHLDSLLCYTAHFAGISEEILYKPYLIYHIDHGSGWVPEREKKLAFNEKLERKGIPSLDITQYKKWVCLMEKFQGPVFFNNGDSWGLGDIALQEEQVTGQPEEKDA